MSEQDQEKPKKRIPLSQVIHVDIDDEVSTIFDRILEKPSDEVFLVVPMRSVLFQSAINVKILKRKTEDIDKKISFITEDKSGIFFANKCKIDVFEHMGGKRAKAEDPNTIARNSRPTKSNKKKKSIDEIRSENNPKELKAKIRDFTRKIKQRKDKDKTKKSLLSANPNRSVLLMLIGGSILILFIISYIALPNATLILKPNSVPIEQAVNVTLADTDANQDLLRLRPSRVMPSYIIDPGQFEIKTTFNSTGSGQDGQSARGIITITNNTNREWPLINRTRFQTDEGLVFRIQSYIAVKPNSTQDVQIVADDSDAEGQIIGDRGNIPTGTTFFIPGLIDQVDKEQLFATAKEDFTGGVTSQERVVTPEDIEAAKQFARKELANQVPDLLQAELEKRNTENNQNLTLLNDSKAIQVGEIDVTVDESLVGQVIPSFEVSARVRAIAIAFDEDQLIDLLKDQIILRKSPDKSLTKIDEEGVTYRVIRIDDNNKIIEITATISGIEQYELSLDKQSGVRLAKKITDHVAGMQVEEAERYLQNLPEIESAEIKTWPFWAPTIPSLAENIKIELKDE